MIAKLLPFVSPFAAVGVVVCVFTGYHGIGLWLALIVTTYSIGYWDGERDALNFARDQIDSIPKED